MAAKSFYDINSVVKPDAFCSTAINSVGLGGVNNRLQNLYFQVNIRKPF
jgi:hypothetical protein